MSKVILVTGGARSGKSNFAEKLCKDQNNNTAYIATSIPFDDEMKERINYLVSHHHTYTNVNGMDYRILLEADFLVNADESEMSENAVETARERVFETNTGKKLLTSIYKLPAR